jgi:hypothetical protein
MIFAQTSEAAYPDQYMAALRTIIAHGRKRIGLLIGRVQYGFVQSLDRRAPFTLTVSVTVPRIGVMSVPMPDRFMPVPM